MDVTLLLVSMAPAPAASGVHREDGSAKRIGGTNRAGDGGRDIVQLEIEKDLESAIQDHPDGGRPAGREELEADLDQTHPAFDLVQQSAARLEVGHVKGQYEPLACLLVCCLHW